MKLDFNEITAIAVGIVRSVKTDKGIELHRFSQLQIDAFDKPNKHFPEPFFDHYFSKNCLSCAGITLDFYTDATEIKITVAENTGIVGAPTGVLDVYIDRKYVRSYTPEGTIIIRTKEKNKRVTVYLPYLNFTVIESVELDTKDGFSPVGKGTDILLMGDSITHGAWAMHPSRNYACIMARKLDARIINQGNSGYVYDEGIVDKVCDPKLIIAAYGTNDRGRKNIEVLKAEARAFFVKVKELYPGTPIAAILPTWSPNDNDEKLGPQHKTAREALIQVYTEAGIEIIDGQELFGHDMKYLQDVVHLNERGFRMYGSRLAKKLIQKGLY